MNYSPNEPVDEMTTCEVPDDQDDDDDDIFLDGNGVDEMDDEQDDNELYLPQVLLSLFVATF